MEQDLRTILGNMIPDGFINWLEIDLSAIENNYHELIRISQRPVMGVVKANAYGHGLERISQAVGHAGGNWLGVARFEEAYQLRKAWIETNTLVLGYTPPEWAIQAAVDKISLTVFDRKTALAYSEAAASRGMRVKVHLKVDTGMNRLGIQPQAALEFLRWLSGLPGLDVEGIFTHFADADEPVDPSVDVTVTQIRRFDEVLAGITAAGLRPKWVHASNSAGILNFPNARYDLVRAGIALYGLHPSPDTILPGSFKPALTWKTILTLVKEVPAGSGISYNYRYFTKSNERIGVIPVGYADGFRRSAKNKVLVGGTEVSVVGHVCMDQCMVLLDNVPQAMAGDEVVIIGEQGSQTRTAEQVAEVWEINNYQVVCGMADRLPRFYS